MSDSKTKPDNPQYLVTEEQHREAWARTRLAEACTKAVYHMHVYQRYEWQDSFHVIEELSPNWTKEEVEEIIKNGITDKVRDDAIKLLTERGAVKKNDGGVKSPSP